MNNEVVLYQGAEAKICKSTYHNFKAIKKRRLKKGYRIREIDEKLISYRTKGEAKLIRDARCQGVSVPIIFDVDLKEGIITMELIDGKRVKDIFNDLNHADRKTLCIKIGVNIARLHNGGIIHGDITTSNMILFEDRIYFIDFGLGEKNNEIEARGVDLHVLMEAIDSTHSQYSDYFRYVMEGYRSELKDDANLVLKKIDDIVRRGRYR